MRSPSFYMQLSHFRPPFGRFAPGLFLKHFLNALESHENLIVLNRRSLWNVAGFVNFAPIRWNGWVFLFILAKTSKNLKECILDRSPLDEMAALSEIDRTQFECNLGKLWLIHLSVSVPFLCFLKRNNNIQLSVRGNGCQHVCGRDSDLKLS